MVDGMSDINTTHFVYSKTPPAWHPYLRLARVDRPTGIWLLLLPCLWALVLSDDSVIGINIGLLAIFTLGAVLLRSAGCVINDLWDHRLDAAVARTQNRPLPAGDITRFMAVLFLGALLLAGLLLLVLLDPLAIWLGIAAMPLVTAYPLMKRITWWPQLFLGITFNWGALMGWAAATGSIAPAAVLLYVGGVFWTLAYDTIYAHQDIEDDMRAGIKSTALHFGARSKTYVQYFLIAAIVCFVLAKYLAGATVLTGLLILPIAGHALWQMKVWQPDSAASSLRVFRANTIFGLFVLVMLAL